jgi:Zn-dependent metalloprotease
MSQFDLDTIPTLSPETAAALAKTSAGEGTLLKTPELLIRPSKNGDSARLIYQVEFAAQEMDFGADIFVDAHSGKILANLSKLQTIAPITVFDGKDQGIEVTRFKKFNPETGKEETEACKKFDRRQKVESEISSRACLSLLLFPTGEAAKECQIIQMISPSSGIPTRLNPSTCKEVASLGVSHTDADQSAINALNNSKRALSYYQDIHGRDSFDGQGKGVINVVHTGVKFANAAWAKDLDYMIYGDGDGETMGDMTRGADVAGHELTHGVVSKTAKLTMMNEAGALNEAYADFFGKMIAQDGTWVLGASLSLDQSRFSGFRDLKSPGNFSSTHHDGAGNRVTRPYPSKISEMEKTLDQTECGGSNDSCWVHFNATIPGHAAYLIHETLGKAKAEMLYYVTLTQYLNSEADFRGSARATLEACKALSDSGRLTLGDCEAAKSIFTEVGMLD